MKNYENFTVTSWGQGETFQLVRIKLFTTLFLWDTLTH